MGMAAILVMWQEPFEQIVVLLSHRSSMWNLTLIGPAVSDEKMFKEFGRRRTTTDDDRRTETYLSYKLTSDRLGLTLNDGSQPKTFIYGLMPDTVFYWARHGSIMAIPWLELSGFTIFSLASRGCITTVFYLSLFVTKPTMWLCAQRRLKSAWGIRPVWSESSLCAQWEAKGPSFLRADSEDSDQTGRMPRLIWVFAERTLTLLVLSCRSSFYLPGAWDSQRSQNDATLIELGKHSLFLSRHTATPFLEGCVSQTVVWILNNIGT